MRSPTVQRTSLAKARAAPDSPRAQCRMRLQPQGRSSATKICVAPYKEAGVIRSTGGAGEGGQGGRAQAQSRKPQRQTGQHVTDPGSLWACSSRESNLHLRQAGEYRDSLSQSGMEPPILRCKLSGIGRDSSSAAAGTGMAWFPGRVWRPLTPGGIFRVVAENGRPPPGQGSWQGQATC